MEIYSGDPEQISETDRPVPRVWDSRDVGRGETTMQAVHISILTYRRDDEKACEMGSAFGIEQPILQSFPNRKSTPACFLN